VPFKVKASPAGILDVLRDGGIKLLFTVLAALIAFLATCASAFATFLSSELPTLAPIAFGFAGLTATIVLGRAIHAALKIEC
jgi:hypothetical protein